MLSNLRDYLTKKIYRVHIRVLVCLYMQTYGYQHITIYTSISMHSERTVF